MKRTIKYTPEEEELLDHIGVITTELEEVLSANTLETFNIPDVNTRGTRDRERIEARILEIASTVANEVYATQMYSDFHTWKAFYDVTTKAAARALAPDLATSIHPFGDCLTMATKCYEELRTNLEAEGPEYAEYVDRVQLVNNNWKQRAQSAREYHCITIVRLPTHCIVVDAVARGTAVSVPLGELTKPPGCASLGFVYIAVGDARLLVEYEPNEPCYSLARPQSKGVFEYDDPYAEIKNGFAGGVADLAFPSVNYHVEGDLPSRREILIHQIWTCPPQIGAVFEELQDRKGWRVETGQMRVNFVKRKITVKKIPYVALRARDETSTLMRRLFRARVLIIPLRPSLGKFKISLADQGDIGFDRVTMEKLELMDEMCEALGMPKGEVLRIAIMMQEVWMDYEEMRMRTKKEGKRSAKIAPPGQTGENQVELTIRPRTT
jgi:hypothetical protein